MRNPSAKKLELYDPLGRPLQWQRTPRCIVSLVPSQTELLSALGLGKRVGGITKFCVHPHFWREKKKIVGGTKKLHLDCIRTLEPDLILANKEENTREEIEALAADLPVWVSDIRKLEDALGFIQQLGKLTKRSRMARELGRQIAARFAALPAWPPLSSLYLIWRDPWMSVGDDTFIHAMMEKAGFTNVLAGRQRYPELQAEEIQALQPEVVLLSSEPYPFKEKHIEELKAILPKSRILLVDGELFSWYGSRLLLSPAYFARLRAGLSGEGVKE